MCINFYIVSIAVIHIQQIYHMNNSRSKAHLGRPIPLVFSYISTGVHEINNQLNQHGVMLNSWYE